MPFSSTKIFQFQNGIDTISRITIINKRVIPFDDRSSRKINSEFARRPIEKSARTLSFFLIFNFSFFIVYRGQSLERAKGRAMTTGSGGAARYDRPDFRSHGA